MRTIRILALLPLLALTNGVAAQGYASSPWPTSAEGRTLPRPDWILAIPARRHADGSLTIWDRTDEWTRAWRVPRVVDGMRVVTLLGDAQDSRSITSQAIDGMMVDEMRVVMEKYGAPALALVVNDGSTVAVAGYVPGWQAGWRSTISGSSDAEARENGVEAIGALFSGGGEQSAPAQAEQASSIVQIVAIRSNAATGGLDYRLVLNGDDRTIQSTIDILAGIPGGNLVDLAREGQSVVAVMQRFAGAPELEQDLYAYGLIP